MSEKKQTVGGISISCQIIPLFVEMVNGNYKTGLVLEWRQKHFLLVTYSQIWLHFSIRACSSLAHDTTNFRRAPRAFGWSHWSGPVFCLLLGVSSDYTQPITGQVTDVTCPVIGRAQPELAPSKRQKMGPGWLKASVEGSSRMLHAWFTSILFANFRYCWIISSKT